MTPTPQEIADLAVDPEAREALIELIVSNSRAADGYVRHRIIDPEPLADAITAGWRPVPPTAVVVQTDAARDVLAERRRQVEVEVWTPRHDDMHADGAIAKAAASYAISSAQYPKMRGHLPPSPWPWDRIWWRPTDRRRDLVKAGALILAEIERLDRAALTPKQETPEG